MNFTYDDVMKKAAEYGLLDSMSDADRKLTLENPNAGMAILNSRNDYRNAATDDARALAHATAEQVRKDYGGYSGGVDGSSYYLTEPTPNSFYQGTAPEFQNPYAERKESVADRILQRQDYASSYGDMQDQLLEQIKNTASDTYDPASDNAYASYAKQYRREGQRATENALGTAAMMTGGVPSSAAMTAASQAGQYYATQLADKLPALAEAAQAQKAQRQNMLLNALSAANQADNTAYQRYLDGVSFNYDDMEMLRALENDAYVQYRDELAQYNTDRDFNYGKFTDDLSYRSNAKETELQKQQYEKEYAEELARAEEEKQWNAALYALEYLNDSTLLKQLIGKVKGSAS